MLMDFMRRNTRNFLIATIVLIVPAFILWGAFPSPAGREERTLIEVGDQEISLQEFTRYYQNIREITRRNLGTSYTPELERLLNLKQQALDRMVREILLAEEVERLDIIVSDEEVQESLKQNPQFYTDGKFDPAKWNRLVGDPRINWTGLIEQERQQLQIQKLVGLIRSEARATEEEVREEFRRQNEKVAIEFVSLPASDRTEEVELTQEELAAYYEEHKLEYLEPARLTLAYVEFEKKPSPMDFADVEAFARGALRKAREGADFARLAETYSDDRATAPKGGDLGFFGKGRMTKEFEQAAFSMEPGQISGLVKTPFGYHIIKVEETRGEGEQKEVRARHILFKVEPSEDTLLSLEEQATRLAIGAKQSSLEQQASEMGLEVSTTPSFPETAAALPTIGPVREITEMLPGMQQGGISDVIESGTAFYVFQVTQREPERIPELAEVKESVREAAATSRALDLAKAKAEQIVTRINESGLTFAEIKNAPQPREVEPFARRGRPPELPRIEGLVDAAFELDEGKAAGPFVTGNTAYVVRLKEKIEPDYSTYESHKESIREALLDRRKEQVFQDYYENLRERHEVRINQELMQAV